MHKFLLRCWFALVLLLQSPILPASEESILVTGLTGQVERMVNGGKEPVLLFSTLRAEELLLFSPDSRLNLLFEKSGRQETWAGKGRLALHGSKTSTRDLPKPRLKTLDQKVTKQLFRGPQILPDGEVKVPRTRSLGTPDALARLENDYRRMRMEAAADDLNPEMYRLSALLEMREKERLEQAIKELPRLYPGNREADLLASLYKKSMKGLSF